ncbi:MAG TPA: hypothetical protein VNH44_00145 [Micropepsaceae bacterium]|nr:hypothetical protein [Micropepsaceae bacterium]
MARVANDLAELPPHMQAVFFRQFAREADLLAHKSTDRDRQAWYIRLSELWRAFAEVMDEKNDLYERVCAPAGRAQIIPFH